MKIYKPLLPFGMGLAITLFSLSVYSQMRLLYVDSSSSQREIKKMSFYSPSHGFAASTDPYQHWVGFTADSGRTLSKRTIRFDNVSYNGYSVNLTFGFYINGVKAFDQNTIIAYGDYGLVPSILYSTDGGLSYTLIYNFQFAFIPNSSIMDMSFPQNSNIGYAVDMDQILKTIDGGKTWSAVRTDQGSNFQYIEAVDDKTVFVLSTQSGSNKILKTIDGGSTWQQVMMPPGISLLYASFLTATKGWINGQDLGTNPGKVYYTSDGGGTWIQKNNTSASPFVCKKFKFVNDSTGFAISGYETFKTMDSGRVWEPIPRDNNFSYLNYDFNDLLFYSSNQLWSAGGLDFIEINTNQGGPTLPQSLFSIDTVGLDAAGTVNLVNYSKREYPCQWFLNNTLISTQYNASYTRDKLRTHDTIKLVVSNSLGTDTLIREQYYYPTVAIYSFAPLSAAAGETVIIKGVNFSNTLSVSFGGVAAASFVANSDTVITATVASGASGNVQVITATGHATIAGFTFIPPPTIVSFSPTSATAGSTITITGTNFQGTTSVLLGGVQATSFIVLSATMITATAPSGPSGNVTVVARGGTASISGYHSLPTLSAFAPHNGTQGTILRISGKSLNEISAITVGGTNVTSFTVISSDSISAIVGAGASGNVNVTSGSGSSSLPGFSWFPPPVIASFIPSSGPVGTTVTINGTGFNAIASNNIVYFGSVRAAVTSSSSTSLNVMVPTGASFGPITVTNHNLIGSSARPFVVTFPNCGSLSTNSFTSPTTINVAPDQRPTNVIVEDIDGDGKNDLVVTEYSTDNNSRTGVLVYRNTTTSSGVSFANPVSLDSLGFWGTASGDLDGDGKPDLAVLSGSTVVIYLNTSAPGQISFSKAGALYDFDGPTSLAIADVDADGKMDIVTSLSSVFRNISDPGAINFAPPINSGGNSGNYNVLLSDLDGDDKPEMIITHSDDATLTILKNNCTTGVISFDAPKAYSGGIQSFIATGDIDGDGKTDIVLADHHSSHMVMYRNMSTPGSIRLDSVKWMNDWSYPYGIGVADLDGDGKLDVATVLGDNTLSLFKNLSAPGAIAFLPQVNVSQTDVDSKQMLAIGDIDGDGKNDIITIAQPVPNILIYSNKGIPVPYVSDFTPTIGPAGTSIVIKGGNFTSVTAVMIGGIPVASFTLDSTTGITATVGGGASGEVTVTNSFGSGKLGGFVFGLPPVITSLSPRFADAGSQITIMGRHFSTNPSDDIVFFGGVQARVITATDTTVSVIVPLGPAYSKVSITVAQRTAYSSEFFSTTFPGVVPQFKTSSFVLALEKYGGYGVATDMDGDGKPDLILGGANWGLETVRNTSTIANISFDPDQSYNNPNGCTAVATGDLDGDGKPDVVAGNNISISVWRNTSTTANINLKYVASYSASPMAIAISDLDADGKPDVIVTNYSSTSSVVVFKNVSTADSIILDKPILYDVNGYGLDLIVTDIDGDGRPDVLSLTSGGVFIFRNISRPGTTQFASPINLGSGEAWGAIRAGDLDGDGAPEIIVANSMSNTISIFHNTSSAGKISFDNLAELSTDSYPEGLSIGDLDGDELPDLFEQNLSSYNYTNSIFKNISSAGTIQMRKDVDFGLSAGPSSSVLADLDGDGASDMLAFVQGSWYAIYRNLTAVADTIKFCTGFDTTIISNVTGTNYQWQQNKNTGAGFVNLIDDNYVGGTNTASLQLKNIASSWSGYEYRCLVNGNRNSRKLVLSSSPVTPSIAISGTTTVNSGTQTEVTASASSGGSNPSFLWQDSTDTRTWKTLNPTLPAITRIYYTPPNAGCKLRCVMISSADCAIPDTVISNVLIFTVNIVTAINPVLSGGVRLKCYPNPASSSINVDSLQLSDKWYKLDVIGGDGKTLVTGINIAGKTTVTVPISALPNGQYIILLTKRNGTKSSLRFIKTE